MSRGFLPFCVRLSAAVIIIILGAVSTAPAAAESFAAPPPSSSPDTFRPPAGRRLVWHDEFSGDSIDTSVWSYETEATGWSPSWNHELQSYTDDGAGGPNAFVSHGALVIRALKDGANGYTSARLVTKNRKSWRYGDIAARIQLPEGKGIWPAFWLLGENGDWPGCGEIDVMEMIGGGRNDRCVRGTLHWNDFGHRFHGGTFTDRKNLSADWHIYEVEWTPTTIKFKFDGVTYHTHDIRGTQYDAFRRPFYLILNLAVGGEWPGNPDATTCFPQYMYVDWVRVYQ